MRILPADAPRARAARTYSDSRAASTAPRTSRVAVGVPQMPTAIVVFKMLGPSTETTAMASSRYGKASSTSTTRMISMSTQPPAKPARQPRASANPSAIATESTPTSSATRLPKMMRERMSRPNSSAPSRNLPLGFARFSIRLCLAGSAGASHGAPAAVTIRIATRTSPAIDRAAPAKAVPGIRGQGRPRPGGALHRDRAGANGHASKRSLSERTARARRRVQMRGGARRQLGEPRTRCTLSRLSRDAVPPQMDTLSWR